MQTELTLMAVPTRNLSLPALRKHVEQRMMQNLKILTNDHVAVEDAEALKALCGTLDSMSCLPAAFGMVSAVLLRLLYGHTLIAEALQRSCLTFFNPQNRRLSVRLHH